MRRRVPDGFTLLELLVALSLLGMMIAALVGGLRLGTRAWESGRVSASLDEAETAARAIASQIERAFPATTRRIKGPPVVAFDGRADSLRFVALSEGEAQWGGLITTEIGAEGAGGWRTLNAWTRVFREEDFESGRDAMRATPLVEKLVYLRLTYFGATDPLQQQPQWRDEWREAAVLPRLVVVRIGLRRPNGVLETAATVALRQQ
jgi:general secretion pathway protein J